MAAWDRGLESRLDALWIVCYAGAALLGVRLLEMQVVRNVYYARVAESNRTQVIHQSAPRGKILDRRGAVLAASKPAFSLIYLPGELRDASQLAGLALGLSRELREDPEDLLKRLREAHQEESAIHLAESLPLKTMFKLSELKTIYPGVDLIVEARRDYPNEAVASHLLGYMGRMDKKNWRDFKEIGYRVDSWIGKAGIEQLYEKELRGSDGESRMEVDAQGHLKRRIGQVPWVPGSNVHLSLDMDVQKAVEEALLASPSGMGGVVAMDPRDGAILAFASSPDFDPNAFFLSEQDKPKNFLKDLPEFNRAIQGSYPPASTFKIVVGAALFEDGRAAPTDTVYCPGHFTVGARTFSCWEKKGHGRMDWHSGLANSCDVYFYSMGLRAGGRRIEEFSKRFHLGRKTGIRFPGENKGNLFGPEARRLRRMGWFEGDTANLSIGQGELLATPIQMAVLMSAVANKGTLWRPYMVSKIVRPDGSEQIAEKPESAGFVSLKKETWDLIHSGLRTVVTKGTGQRVNLPELEVYGKTGTAQNPHGKDHAWFVAFAGRPGELPRFVVSVLVQQGGHGSSSAGPVARRAIEAAFGIGQNL